MKAKVFSTVGKIASIASLAALPLLANATSHDASAQNYPDRAVRIVVPFAAGGATDLFGRLVASELTGILKQQFIVENKPGGGGNIGSNQVAKSAADGYTLLFGAAGNIAINPALFSNMPYIPSKDLAPVALMGSSMNVLVVPSSLPVKSVQELIALEKAKPGELNYGSSGNGGTTHLSGELFNSTANTRIVHVPYQGSGPAMIDLLAARVQMMFDNLPSSLPHIQRGDLRALGVTGASRSALLPDVPTIAESGLPGFEATTWFGLFAPAGTPPAVIEKINAAVNQAMAKPEIIERLRKLGTDVATGTPDSFAELVKRDTEKWAKVIKDANIVMN